MTPLSQLVCADRAPDSIVAWTAHRTVCWRDFRRDVGRLATALRGRPEERWLLACEEPYDFTVALLAVWHAARRAVVPPSMQAGAIDEIAVNADGVLRSVEDWPAVDGPTDMATSAALVPFDAVHAHVDLYTSGSTGVPKRIDKSARQLELEIATLEQCWGGPAEAVFATVPHHHIYGLLFRLLWPLAAGRPFDSVTCPAPEFLLARLEALGPGRVVSSPSQLNRMPELIDLTQLRGKATRLFSSGGPLGAPAAERFAAALGTAPVEIFGSTETGGVAWRIQRAGDDAWTALPGVRTGLSENGALTLRSPFLADDQAFETSDAATMLPDGRFRLCGRLDRIVKIEEKRLSLNELEQRLAAHPWVCEAAAVVLPGHRQTLGAVIALSDSGRAELARIGRAAMATSLRTHLAQWFDAVLLPRRWRYPATLPYNERGKLATADLVAQFAGAESGRG